MTIKERTSVDKRCRVSGTPPSGWMGGCSSLVGPHLDSFFGLFPSRNHRKVSHIRPTKVEWLPGGAELVSDLAGTDFGGTSGRAGAVICRCNRARLGGQPTTVTRSEGKKHILLWTTITKLLQSVIVKNCVTLK